jgi:hypothetical protein
MQLHHQRTYLLQSAFHRAFRDHNFKIQQMEPARLPLEDVVDYAMQCQAQRPYAPSADRIGCAPIKSLCAFAMKLRAAALRIVVI